MLRIPDLVCALVSTLLGGVPSPGVEGRSGFGPVHPLETATGHQQPMPGIKKASGGRRNVLVLLADDLGVDMLQAYGEGSDLPVTPNIDSLATQGVVFRNAWSNPICSPTRAGIQTGRHAFRTGIGALVGPTGPALPLAETTLPELLDAGGSGYAHGLFGKWHLGNQSVGGANSPIAAGWSWFDGSMCSLEPPPFSYYLWPRIQNGSASISTRWSTAVTVDAAISWILGQSEPWVCFVSFQAPHAPLNRPPAGTFTQSLDDPSGRNLYKAMIENMDFEIGRLLDSIEPSQSAPPVVIFAGDNGTPTKQTLAPFDPQHAKGTLFEGGINVPLIVSGWGTPGFASYEGRALVHTGYDSQALVHTNDVFATVADIAGIDPVEILGGTPIDSQSLLPLLAAPGGSGRLTVFTEIFSQTGLPAQAPQRAIRSSRYKLIRLVHSDLFYDLRSDPFEQTNLLLGGLNRTQYAAYKMLSNALVALTGST